jgi:VWFA-related protein
MLTLPLITNMNRGKGIMIRRVLLVCIGLVFSGVISAQSAKEDVISSTTELVTVPVVVTDNGGKSVHGLKQEDFHVEENGKDQRIASFEEVTAARITLSGSTEQNGIYTNRLINENPVALGILVIDFVNTRTVAQAWALRGALSLLHKWKGKGEFQQPMMVAAITSRGLRIIHQATSDPEVLEAALQLLRPEPAPGVDNKSGIESPYNPARGPDNQAIVIKHATESDDQFAKRAQAARREADVFDQMERSNEVVRQNAQDADTTTTMWALTAIANGVAGIPGRKAMIWCAEEFPFRLMAGVFESPQWTAKHGTMYEDPEIQALRDATLLAFNQANISVYPVNAAGLLTPSFYDASAVGRPMIGTQWSSKMVRSGDSEMDNRNYARILADKTSGTPCLSSNDIGDCIGRALDDASHYYMLAYYPNPKPKGTGYRRIKVEVKGEKLRVHARENYWYGTVPTFGVSPKSELAVALGSNLDYTTLPINFKFTGVKPGPQGKQMVDFVIGIDGRALGIDEEHDNHISLLMGAQAKEGDPPTLLSIDTKLKSELVPQIRAKQLTHKGEIELAPGKYEVRLVVRDNLSGKIGSVIAPIEVR